MSILDNVFGTCVTNLAYVFASAAQSIAIVVHATLDAAIQTVVANWQRDASKSIQQMQQELADRQVLLAERVQAHAEIFWPEEAELVADAFAASKVTPQYLAMMSDFGNLSQSALQDGRDDWVSTMRAACMAPSRCEDARWYRYAGMISIDLQNFGARQEESRAQILNDRRYARQYNVLAGGRGTLSAMLSYQNIARVSSESTSNMLASTVNSALTAFGYAPARLANGGWGSGIQETWAKTYMPSAMAVERTRIDVQPQVTVQDLAPVRFEAPLIRAEQQAVPQTKMEAAGFATEMPVPFRGVN